MRKAILAVLSIALTAPFAWSFEAPRNSVIDTLLADPASMDDVIDGATAGETADVVSRAITRSNVRGEARKQVVATLVAKAIASREDAQKAPVLDAILSSVDEDDREVAAASGLVSTSNALDIQVIVRRWGLAGVLTDPEGILGTEITKLVIIATKGGKVLVFAQVGDRYPGQGGAH